MYLEKVRKGYYAEKDAVLRHYIELHPDDFPRPGECGVVQKFLQSNSFIFFKFTVRMKYKEVLEEWIPIR